MNKLFTILWVVVVVFHGTAQELYFPPSLSNDWDTIAPSDLGWCADRIDSLYEMLEENNTNAFMVLKDGKIVLEKYFAPFARDSFWYWASAGKSLTAVLVGIAQEEGFLSIEESTSQYLGEGWSDCFENEANITIHQQLTMTTGFDDDVADAYCTIDTCLICLADPGTRWAYHNAPYTLLDGVISAATNQSLNAFMQNRVTDLTGINGLFLPVGYNHVFFSKARSMARFGLLMLNKGVWDNVDVLEDTTYFNQMVNTSQAFNKAYGYLWWLNGKESFMLPGLQFVFPGSLMPNAPDDMIAALGKNGQYINVVPGEHLVLIRMGDAPSGEEVPTVLNNRIWQYMNVLNCQSTAVEDPRSDVLQILVYPNPAGSNCHIECSGEPFDVSLFDVLGKKVHHRSNCQEAVDLHLDVPTGVYWIQLQTSKGTIYCNKLQVVQ